MQDGYESRISQAHTEIGGGIEAALNGDIRRFSEQAAVPDRSFDTNTSTTVDIIADSDARKAKGNSTAQSDEKSIFSDPHLTDRDRAIGTLGIAGFKEVARTIRPVQPTRQMTLGRPEPNPQVKQNIHQKLRSHGWEVAKTDLKASDRKR